MARAPSRNTFGKLRGSKVTKLPLPRRNPTVARLRAKRSSYNNTLDCSDDDSTSFAVPVLGMRPRMGVAPKKVSSRNRAYIASPIGSSEDRIVNFANEETFAIVCRIQNGQWTFLRACDRAFEPSNVPILYPMTEIKAMAHIWKRVVLDGSITIDDYNQRADPATMRVIKYSFNMQEITSSIFFDDIDYSDALKRSGVSKLNRAEVEALGLSVELSKHLLLTKSEFSDKDRDTMRALTETGAWPTIDVLEDLLKE